MWALDCWPVPVALADERGFYPFVAGDSMVEAARLARTLGIPIRLVDLPVERESTPGKSLPDPSWALGDGTRFMSAVASLEMPRVPRRWPISAREAVMATTLAELAEQFERVLWVGGMANWPRMRARSEPARLRRADGRHLAGAPVRAGPTRCRGTDGCATGRWPWQVSEYAKQPDAYEESGSTRALAIAALDKTATPDVRLCNGRGAEDKGGSIGGVDGGREPPDAVRAEPRCYAEPIGAPGFRPMS